MRSFSKFDIVGIGIHIIWLHLPVLPYFDADFNHALPSVFVDFWNFFRHKRKQTC